MGFPNVRNFLTFPRDHSKIVGKTFGPSNLGEFWKAEFAEYDAATDTTRVGYSLVVRGR